MFQLKIKCMCYKFVIMMSSIYFKTDCIIPVDCYLSFVYFMRINGFMYLYNKLFKFLRGILMVNQH